MSQFTSWMWMLPNSCYRHVYCTLLWFYGNFGIFRRYSHVTLNGRIYTISSWDVVKMLSKRLSWTRKSKMPFADINYLLESVSKWFSEPESDETRFTSGGKMGPWLWAFLPDRFIDHEFLHIHWWLCDGDYLSLHEVTFWSHVLKSRFEVTFWSHVLKSRFVATNIKEQILINTF